MDELDKQMRQLLAEMSVLSEVPANMLGDRTKGGDKARAPRLDGRPLVDEFRDRYNGAHSLGSRRAVVEAAEAALQLARCHVTQISGLEPEHGSYAWKCKVANATGDVGDVARWYGVHRTTVVRYRQTYRGLLGGSSVVSV